MNAISLIIVLYVVALLCGVSVWATIKYLDKWWKWFLVFILASIACACAFLPLNVIQGSYGAKNGQNKPVVDTLELVNQLKTKYGY